MSDSPTPTLSLDAAVATAPTKRALPYLIRGDRAPVTGGGHVGRGTSVKTGDWYVIHADGQQQQALRIQAFAGAIFHGVISPAEVLKLWKMAADVAALDEDEIRILFADTFPDAAPDPAPAPEPEAEAEAEAAPPKPDVSIEVFAPTKSAPKRK